MRPTMRTPPVPTGPSIDEEFVTRTAAELVRIDSINPALDPRAKGEAEIAAHIGGVLEQIGAEVEVVDSPPGRPSVVGRLHGTGGGRSLMLNAHFDTVGTEGMDDPFSAVVRDGRLYGRGAYDMKGSLASCLGAAKALADSGVRLKGDVLVAAVADEEAESLGMQAVLERFGTDGAIVTEPTDLQICLAHKGFLWIEIEAVGRAAHGSRPDLGIDANLAIGAVLHALREYREQLRERPPHSLVGRPSVHAATLRGGIGLSTYADRAVLGIERRTVPGETGAEVLQEFADLLEAARRHEPDARFELRHLLTREPFEGDPGAPLTAAVSDAALAVTGSRPRVEGQGPWMDSALLQAAGVETVVIGPRGEGAHAREEWVDLASLHALARILVEAAVRYCG